MVYKELSFSNKIGNLHYQEMKIAIHPKGLLVEITDSKYRIPDYRLTELDVNRFAISYKNLDKFLFTGYNLHTALQLLENCFKTGNLDLAYLRKAAELSTKISMRSFELSDLFVKINGVNHSQKFRELNKLYGSKMHNALKLIFGETDKDFRIYPENPDIKHCFGLYKRLGLAEKESEILDSKELQPTSQQK